MRQMNLSMNGAALYSGHIYASYVYQKWQNACRSVSGCGTSDMAAVSLLLIKYHFFTNHILELYSFIAHKLKSKYVLLTVEKIWYLFRVTQGHVLLENTCSLKYSNNTNMYNTCTILLCSASNISEEYEFRNETTRVNDRLK
jgi:uncharacterized membrane protein YoaT (DUF817 family)